MYFKNTHIDFSQVDDIESIKELIIHNCDISNFSCISAAKNLKEIVMVECNIAVEDLSCLKEMEKLKELRFRGMKMGSILWMSEIPSLKNLALIEINDIDYSELEYLPNLLRLYIEQADVPSFDFLKKLKKLHTFELDMVPVNNLDFLYDLPKLKEFRMSYRTADEKALSCISNMKYLQSFLYPVRDISIYKDCPKIKYIGLDGSIIHKFKVLEGKDSITSVFFFNCSSQRYFERESAKAKNYLNLTSCGYGHKI